MTLAQARLAGDARLSLSPLERRALALWPRIDRAALRRCHNDATRIAALVARRTAMPQEAIRGLLTMPAVGRTEIDTWFG
jgi:hypothetical protein